MVYDGVTMSGTSEQVKLRILAHLLDAKEAHASKLEEIAGCANKTFLKVRKHLEEEGLIKKYYEPKPRGGIYAKYYIPEEKRKDVEIILQKASMKQDLLRIVDKASLEELQRLKKELLYQKALNELHDIDETDCFPLKFLMERLLAAGFHVEDFYNRKEFSEEEWEQVKNSKVLCDSGKLTNVMIVKPERMVEAGLDDIEIKIVNVKDPKIKYFLWEGKQIRKFGGYKLRLNDFWGDWIRVTSKPVKGKHIFARYTKRVKLAKEIFDYEVLKWKEKFSLLDDEWKELEPWIRETMQFEVGRVDLPLMIVNGILNYLADKPNFFERVKQYFKNEGLSDEEASNATRQTLEHIKANRETVNSPGS